MLTAHDVQITKRLDELANSFLEENPNFGQLTIRNQALLLVAWLRSRRLVGLNGPETTYRNLRNCLLGHALLREGHNSLPIISCVIYCCIAQRIGLKASPTGFPYHVRVVISASERDLDGHSRGSGPPGWSERMFLDPYRMDGELSEMEVRAVMRDCNIVDYPGTHNYAWLEATPSDLVSRNAHNILETRQQYRHASVLRADTARQLADLGHGVEAEENMERASYASFWALVYSTRIDDPLWRNQYHGLLGNIITAQMEDLWLLEKVGEELDDSYQKNDPLRRPLAYSDTESARNVLRLLYNLDNRQATVHRRYAKEITSKVQFRIGQVFRHARYEYIGIIVGWDPDGTATFGSGSNSIPMFDRPDDEDMLAHSMSGSQLRHPTGVYYQCM
jgi:F-box protein 21